MLARWLSDASFDALTVAQRTRAIRAGCHLSLPANISRESYPVVFGRIPESS